MSREAGLLGTKEDQGVPHQARGGSTMSGTTTHSGHRWGSNANKKKLDVRIGHPFQNLGLRSHHVKSHKGAALFVPHAPSPLTAFAACRPCSCPSAGNGQ